MHPALLHLLVDRLLVLDCVAAELTDCAFTNGIVQDEEVQVAESVSFLLHYLVDVDAHLARCVTHEAHGSLFEYRMNFRRELAIQLRIQFYGPE